MHVGLSASGSFPRGITISFEPEGAQIGREAFARGRGLHPEGDQQVTESTAQPMKLVDLAENDRDAFVVDAKVSGQVLDQSRPRKIDF